MMLLDFILALIGFIMVITFIVGIPMTFGVGTLLILGFLCTSVKAMF